MRRFAASLLVPLLAPAGLFAGPAAADTSALAVHYRPPVDATPLVDTFRPPATPYGAGNRGIDYATAAGQA
ncbi:MAG TPA: hypothetical protein VM933_05500, partial [Acidimicrobiales bacterium]|nr:hypothetical protein [Acidimicrobiales bacterium]